MGISPYIERLRGSIGSELLLLPSVAVLARDDQGRLLLVRQADFGQWATISGTVEPDESPDAAARREALEEAGVEVELRGIGAALGGPGYRKTYPDGDRSSYVVIVYDAVISSGSPTPDHDETTEVGWFTPHAIESLDLGELNRTLLRDVALLGAP